MDNDKHIPSVAEAILNDLLLNGGVLGKDASMVIKAIGEIRAMESRSDDLAIKLAVEAKRRNFYQNQAQSEREKNRNLEESLIKEKANKNILNRQVDSYKDLVRMLEGDIKRLHEQIDQKNRRELEIDAEVARIQRQGQAEHEELTKSLKRERAKVLVLASMNANLTRKNRNTLEKLRELATLSGFIIIID